jgi:hypothetical protein
MDGATITRTSLIQISRNQPWATSRASGASDGRSRGVGDGWGSKGVLANGCSSVRWPEVAISCEWPSVEVVRVGQTAKPERLGRGGLDTLDF